MKKNHIPKNKYAFTLIELLSVIAIISILAAIVIPSARLAVTRANLAKCVANLNCIGAGFMLFASEKGGYLPGHGAAKNERWYNTVATYIDLSRESEIKQRDQSKYPGEFVRVVPDPNRCAVFRCSEVDAANYNGPTPDKKGIYRNNVNVLLKDALLGLHVDAIPFPSHTVLLADCYFGEGAVDRPDMVRNDPPYPQGSKTGPSANHRFDGNPGADPLGSGQCPMLFADGHVEAVALEQLRPWSNCIKSAERPKSVITMVP